VRQRVFEHFFSTKKDGLGMGLAIARSIVESFGGSLDATNAPDGGAVFYFNLPAYINRSK
jgi:two-component system, LuxR family, sensor kinase FixL